MTIDNEGLISESSNCIDDGSGECLVCERCMVTDGVRNWGGWKVVGFRDR